MPVSRSLRVYTYTLIASCALLGCAGAVAGSADPTARVVVDDIRREAVPFSAGAEPLPPRAQVFLSRVTGQARVVGFGEAKHGLHEMLILRNRMFEYLVEHLRFTALAAETGFIDGTAVDDYVTGSNSVTPQQAAYGVFTFAGEHAFAENLTLVNWIRAYNARPTTTRKIHFYGLDMTGRSTRSQPGNTFARRASDAVIGYVESVDPQQAHGFRDLLGALSARSQRPRSHPYTKIRRVEV